MSEQSAVHLASPDTYIKYAIQMFVCLSVRMWTESCLLCNFYDTSHIHFIFTHLIKQLQKVCHMLSFLHNSLTWDLIWINNMGNHGMVFSFTKRHVYTCKIFIRSKFWYMAYTVFKSSWPRACIDNLNISTEQSFMLWEPFAPNILIFIMSVWWKWCFTLI